MGAIAAFLVIVTISNIALSCNALGTDEKWYSTELVRTNLLSMLATDSCTAPWPNTTNCVEWFTDTDEQVRYVLTNSIPPFLVEPYCPFGVGKGYCLPDGATNCSQFQGITCPGQQGAPPTGDVWVPQVMLYAFDLFPDPTNASRPLNLYELNPLTWAYDGVTGMEDIVDHRDDYDAVRRIAFLERALFATNAKNGRRRMSNDPPPPPPNQAFQTTGVHEAGIQIKGPAEAEGFNVDTVDIPLLCGGHVTPPIGAGPLYHFHKASTCLMMANASSGTSHSARIGYANDGFAIYGFYDIDAKTPTVDECNGHFGCVDDACVEVTYHYHAVNYSYAGAGQFTPYYTGCLGPSKGLCNSTVHQQFDDGANWCGAGCGYDICVQPGTDHSALHTYIASFGDAQWLSQFTVNPF